MIVTAKIINITFIITINMRVANSCLINYLNLKYKDTINWCLIIISADNSLIPNNFTIVSFIFNNHKPYSNIYSSFVFIKLYCSTNLDLKCFIPSIIEAK